MKRTGPEAKDVQRLAACHLGDGAESLKQPGRRAAAVLKTENSAPFSQKEQWASHFSSLTKLAEFKSFTFHVVQRPCGLPLGMH